MDLASRFFRPHWPFLRLPTSSAESSDYRDDGAGQTGSICRPVDVVCAGMYRACSTWQYEVVAHLLEQRCDGRRLGYLTGEQYARLVRSDAAERPAGDRAPARWRVVKSHEGARAFAYAIAANRAIAVYCHRDVRDVVFSLMHKRGMTFEQILRRGMIHQILANDRFWSAQPGVLIQRYDDLIADSAAAVTELARHLSISIEPAEAAAIAQIYSAEANRARTESLRRRLHAAGVDLTSGDNVQICDPTTLLHWNHMRQSNAASWRTAATQAQRAVLDRLCGRWLDSHGYPPDPGLAPQRAAIVETPGEALRSVADVFAGQRTFLIRSASQRWPGVARALKRGLGLTADGHAGATAWADATPTESDSRGRQGEHLAAHIESTQVGDAR
jgi:hypothetical protein